MIILVMTVTMMMKVEESLTGRVIAAHGDIVRKLHNVEEAQRARDAFTKVEMMLVVVTVSWDDKEKKKLTVSINMAHKLHHIWCLLNWNHFQKFWFKEDP